MRIFRLLPCIQIPPPDFPSLTGGWVTHSVFYNPSVLALIEIRSTGTDILLDCAAANLNKKNCSVKHGGGTNHEDNKCLCNAALEC